MIRSERRAHAHRPRTLPSARQVAKALLIVALCAAIFVAWTAIPEPDLMDLR